MTDLSPEQQIYDLWNERAEKSGLPKARIFNGDRPKKVKNLIRLFGYDGVVEAIDIIHRTPFCRGQNDRSWKAHFDFLLQPKSCRKVLEGVYGELPPDAKPSNLPSPVNPWAEQLNHVKERVNRIPNHSRLTLEHYRSLCVATARRPSSSPELVSDAEDLIKAIDGRISALMREKELIE